mgnify:CR=1 FL=1
MTLLLLELCTSVGPGSVGPGTDGAGTVVIPKYGKLVTAANT